MIEITELRCTCGAAPVQFHGALSNGKHLYFRARWDAWSLGIGATFDSAVEASMQLLPDGFARAGDYGDAMFDASYMPHTVAEEIIRRCVAEYAAQEEERYGRD